MKFFKILLVPILLVLLSNFAWAAENYVVYYHNDALGSPVAATDEQGAVLWKEHYLPYGEKAINDQKAFNEKIGYTGKAFDREIGLSYYGVRYYDPVVGRFMGIDPVGFQEDNIHSSNRYAYANNNPLSFIDPDGKTAKKINGTELNLLGNFSSLRGFSAGGSIRSSGGKIQLGLKKKPIAEGISKSATITKRATGAKGGKRQGKPHTQAAKKLSRQRNRDQNNGELVCPTCGNKMVEPSQRVEGKKVHPNEANGDHIYPKAHGGDGATVKDMRNIETKCFSCNLKKSDSLP